MTTEQSPACKTRTDLKMDTAWGGHHRFQKSLKSNPNKSWFFLERFGYGIKPEEQFVGQNQQEWRMMATEFDGVK